MDSQYFGILQNDLKRYGQGTPQLIVDKAIFFQNLNLIKALFKDQIYPRLVVKSLANISLLTEAAAVLDTDRFMVFHFPQLIAVLEAFPEADILLGKPMPLKVLQQFYEHYPQYSQSNIQWLVDDEQRLQQYLCLAKAQKIKLKVNVEIDVGLHRGGVQSEQDFLTLLKICVQHRESLIFSGLMGYDAHVAKLPTWLKKTDIAYAQSQQIYMSYQKLILSYYPELWHEQLCFNGGGSPTLMLHTQKSVCNDVAFGSILLKPSDFDLTILESFQPALWIATPILKVLPQAEIPALEFINKIPFNQQAIFIYGGYWMANYIYPQGLKPNILYGRSTNQEMLISSKKQKLMVDDYVFARPTQSESILPQFAELYYYQNHQFISTKNLRE